MTIAAIILAIIVIAIQYFHWTILSRTARVLAIIIEATWLTPDQAARIQSILDGDTPLENEV